MRLLPCLLVLATTSGAVFGCTKGTIDPAGSEPGFVPSSDEAGTSDGATSDAAAIPLPDGATQDDATPVDPVPSPGRATWGAKVQPLVAEKCGSCHSGARFAFASLRKTGDAFTADDTEANYQKFLELISFDAPKSSRMLGKMDGAIAHAGGAVAKAGDAIYDATAAWVEEERGARCPDCGTAATKQWLAYVESPEIHWALSKDPIRRDHGLRGRAKIMVRALDPKTLKPTGDAIDFLPTTFCGSDGRCDFENLAVSYQGDRMAFDCRLSLDGKDWVDDVRWNVCVAEIGEDGRAVNPRFLAPVERRHHGDTISRSDPFGLLQNGKPLKGPYDLHYQVRRRRDATPTFSPDGARVYFASMGPDPRTGGEAAQTYHGFEHLGNIVAAKIDGSDPRTIYLNEGGVADLPFFLRNGNVAFHTWNLERMDRHLYSQSTADGASDLPVLLGAIQGPNMWGRALQLENGLIFGITGRRRSSIENYVPFVADHTLGTGNDAELAPFSILDTTVYEQVLDFPTGYCTAPPDGPSCTTSRYYADASWFPDGRALVAHNPEKTYVQKGEDMWLNYAKGTGADGVASLQPFVPHKLGISVMDHKGAIERLLEPAAGTAITSPVWIGKRRAPRDLGFKTNETTKTADLHVANVPAWFSFTFDPGAKVKNAPFSSIVALRVMVKELDRNACTNDGRPYRHAVNDGAHDHPTHLGKNNSTGFTKLAVSVAAGGDAYGDVPLRADGSVFLRVPAGKPLFFQGIDAKGHVVVQRSRLFTLPPGPQTVHTSVRAEQYTAQCMSCHGTLDGKPFVGLKGTASIPFAPLDFDTLAAKLPPIDASLQGGATPKKLTFLDTLRPIFDKKCVGCHSGNAPAGELSLEAAYSKTGNYPAGKWAKAPLADGAYLSAVPADKRVPAYNYSVAFAWGMREDEAPYKEAYAAQMASWEPLAGLAPWDPAYQNLFAHDNTRFLYLGGYFTPNFGRSDRLGGVAKDSFLVELLSGRDLDPTRAPGATSHTGFLTEAEVRDVISVIDVGFPYMATCDGRVVPSGPNTGKPWGDVHPLP